MEALPTFVISTVVVIDLWPRKVLKNALLLVTALHASNRSLSKRRPFLCHPEQTTCLRQVKSEMNAEN
jgi:hypothetical protein